jgi:hypothetical protein
VDENLGLMLVMTRRHYQGSTLLPQDIRTGLPVWNAFQNDEIEDIVDVSAVSMDSAMSSSTLTLGDVTADEAKFKLF